MSRLFTFGCSFTEWVFPTWADLLSNHATFSSFENWGQRGSGNRAIFNRLSEATVKSRINKDDTVVIMWSMVNREDRYVDQRWVPVNGIHMKDRYAMYFVEKYLSPVMGLIETCNYVNASKHILENLGCNYAMSFLWMPTIESVYKGKTADYRLDEKEKISILHAEMLSNPRLTKVDVTEYRNNNHTHDITIYADDGKLDRHPCPILHYYYLKEHLLPILKINDFDTDNKILNLATEWTKFLKIKTRNIKDKPVFSYTERSTNKSMLGYNYE